jgi:hypothetical protein
MPSRGMMTSSALAAFQFWWSASPRPATVSIKAIVSRDEYFFKVYKILLLLLLLLTAKKTQYNLRPSNFLIMIKKIIFTTTIFNPVQYTNFYK